MSALTRIVFLICAISLELLGSGWTRLMAQVEFSEQKSSQVGYFEVDVITRFDPAQAQPLVKVLYKVAGEGLQFLKTDHGFRAQFEVSAYFYDQEGYQVEAEVQQDSMIVATYDDTRSSDLARVGGWVFLLPVGTYRMRATVRDLDSNDEYVQERAIRVPALDSDHLSVSDIEFINVVKVVQQDKGQQTTATEFLPHMSRIYGRKGEQLYIAYEVYVPSGVPSGRLEIKYIIRNRKGKKILTQEETKESNSGINRYWKQFDIGQLAQGVYSIEIRIDDKQKSPTVSPVVSEFYVQWPYLLPIDKGYDEILQQLSYIAKPAEIKEMKKAKTLEEKQQVLAAFWKRRDPTPDTQRNEQKLAFYRRVQYANEQFTDAFRSGWKSDMGQVYIILGAPDEIERHPFETDSRPYQIWHYYGLSRSFMFVDEKGFGAYTLWRVY